MSLSNASQIIAEDKQLQSDQVDQVDERSDVYNGDGDEGDEGDEDEGCDNEYMSDNDTHQSEVSGGSAETGDSSHIAIDLSENEIYKGICTLFEDQEGNNILEYISLLHSESIGLNKTMKAIKKDLGRIADCAELMAAKMK